MNKNTRYMIRNTLFKSWIYDSKGKVAVFKDEYKANKAIYVLCQDVLKKLQHKPASFEERLILTDKIKQNLEIVRFGA